MNGKTALEQLHACRWLFLRELGEPSDNSLRLVIEEATTGAEEDMEILGVSFRGSNIESDVSCRLFEVVWESYVAYCVRNESYVQEDATERWEGSRRFRVYSESRFREFVGASTFASDSYPGPLRTWEVVVENHIIDIVSSVEPAIRLLRSAGLAAPDPE